jgi:hypothetical protein
VNLWVAIAILAALVGVDIARVHWLDAHVTAGDFVVDVALATFFGALARDWAHRR